LGLLDSSRYAFHINYSFDRVDDPFQKTFTADSNVDQSFSRFRVAFAKDFRFSPPGEAGFLPHVSVGGGIDAGYEKWEFKSDVRSATDHATTYGGGAGLLIGVYDDTEFFKMNLGFCYQSGMNWKFAIDPQILPAFDMPQQINAGATFYLLKGAPLRATIDTQWISWKDTAEKPLFPGAGTFQNATNVSVGFEYRVEVIEGIALYPRAGYRRFVAPWSDKNDLPMTSNYKLVLDTKGSVFNIATFGVGVSWSSDQGKLRSVDIAGDVGADSYNFALGFNYEF
jgi:hypothetical protein